MTYNDEEEAVDHKYVQTTVSIAQAKEIDDYIRINKIKNKRVWIRKVLLEEVRKDGTKPLPLH